MQLADLAWTDAEARLKGATVFWPVGAVEAHGPHLPLSTDILIAEEMVRRAVARFAASGKAALALPALSFTPATYAGSFAGTLSLSPGTAAAVICDVARSLDAHGAASLVIASPHVDPSNLASIHAAVEAISRGMRIRPIFPDLTRKPWVLKMHEEFKRGGAHAGRFETSLVLAVAPQLVNEAVRRSLPAVQVDLGAKIKAGAKSFLDCGGDRAYFGDPAAASAEEGRAAFDVLASILEEACA